MRKINHPNIIKIYDVFQDARYFYFVMEYLEGPTLFDGLEKDTFENNEKNVREVFRSIINAINYLHKSFIAHRDIKPENIMFLDKTMKDIKVIDFGVSKYFFNKQNPKKQITLRTRTGTIFYASPEVFEGHYDSKCDIWSAGVLLYMMLSGYLPFYDLNPKIVEYMVKNMNYNFANESWSHISEEAKDLIRHMIAPQTQRYTAEDVLNHSWMKIKMEKPTFEIPIQNIKQFLKQPAIVRLFGEFLAGISSEAEHIMAGKYFVSLDEDGDGVITRDELIAGIKCTI